MTAPDLGGAGGVDYGAPLSVPGGIGDLAAAPPGPVVAERITKLGRWRFVDPLRPGRVWNRRRWLGLLGWAALVGAALGKAWRDTGGLGRERRGGAAE